MVVEKSVRERSSNNSAMSTVPENAVVRFWENETSFNYRGSVTVARNARHRYG